MLFLVRLCENFFDFNSQSKVFAEQRVGSERPVDEIRQLRRVRCVEVGLHGHEQRFGRVRVLAEDGLAADDDEVLLPGHIGRGADDVLEVPAGHAFHRSDSVTSPLNGWELRRRWPSSDSSRSISRRSFHGWVSISVFHSAWQGGR